MKLKKRKKSNRMRGTRYHGFAAKKHKGSGNKGGKGMAGTGKKAGQKITYIKKYFPDYFGKESLKAKEKIKGINIRDVMKNLGKWKKGEEVLLKDYKVLGSGEINEKLTIKASKFSKKAKEKIETAGGKIILLGKESKPEE